MFTLLLFNKLSIVCIQCFEDKPVHVCTNIVVNHYQLLTLLRHHNLCVSLEKCTFGNISRNLQWVDSEVIQCTL